jgi:hypothetical protein
LQCYLNGNCGCFLRNRCALLGVCRSHSGVICDGYRCAGSVGYLFT